MFRQLTLLTILAGVHGDETFTGEGTSYTLGQVSDGNCNFMYAPDVGENYAALNDDQWASTRNCGRCAQVACADPRCSDTTTTEIVYIVDRCPECKQGDLDLSPTVFKKLTGSEPSRYKLQWTFVNCPVQGNIKYCTKSGSSSSWLAIQPTNVASGVASIKIANQAVTMVDSCYYYLLAGGTNVDMSAVTVELTSISGETITDKLNLSPDSCTDGTYNFGDSTTQQQVSPISLPPPATLAPSSPLPPPAVVRAVPPTIPQTGKFGRRPPQSESETQQRRANSSSRPLESSVHGTEYKAGQVWPSDQAGRNADASTLQPTDVLEKTPDIAAQVNWVDSANYTAGTVVTAQEAPLSTPEQEPLRSVDQPVPTTQELGNQLRGSPAPIKYNAGEVLAPDESKADVSILQSDQSDIDTILQADGPARPVEQATTKSAQEPVGTSSFIVGIIVLAIVGAIVLAAIAYVVKKKHVVEKRIDRDEAMIRAFDSFSSPVEINTTNIARI